VPAPGQDEVLIKVEFSPINPSDLYSIQGTYRPTPHVLGIEGSGTVVRSGGGDLADSLVG